VGRARAIQAQRFAGHSWRLNAHAPGPELRTRWPLTVAAQSLLDAEIYAGRLTRRGGTRVHRLAWTVADLAGITQPDVREFDTALRLRTGAPLMVEAMGSALSSSASPENPLGGAR